MVFLQKCCFNTLLVELIFFTYKTGESMLDATIRPYIVKVACWQKHLENMTICSEIGLDPVEEDNTQIQAANYLMLYRILVNIPAIFLGLFCGAWSDKYGRKLPMLLPSLGSVFAVLLYMMSIVAEEWTLPLVMIGAIVQGMFGKSSVITMAVNSYASDISDKEDRTKILGRLLAMNFFGLFLGSLLSGVLQDTASLETTLCIVVCVHAATVLLTVFFMDESIPLRSKKVDAIENDKSECLDIINISNLKDSFTVLTKPRVQNARCIIALLFVASIVNASFPEQDITVLFVTRSPLNWSTSWYGYLMSVDCAVMGLTLLLVLPVLSNLFKLPDIVIILIGIVCKIVRLVWAGFCRESWMVYTSVVIGAFAGLVVSAVRSLMSKTVDEDELGKTFSLLASGETASKLFGTVIFVSIYSATAYFLPGFAYLVEAFVYILMLLIMLWMYRELRNTGTYDLIQALSPKKVYGTAIIGPEYKVKVRKQVIDELEEEPTYPQPLPATTP